MNKSLSKNELVVIIQTLLKTDADLAFLLDLEHDALQTMAACVRDRIEKCE